MATKKLRDRDIEERLRVVEQGRYNLVLVLLSGAFVVVAGLLGIIAALL